MHNLASTYSKLKKHSEALAMKEMVLEFRSRVLPADHPSIGKGHVCNAVARTFADCDIVRIFH
jgi:hypothetical protein